MADLSGGCQFEGQAGTQADCSGSYTFDPRFAWSYPMATSPRASASISARPQDGTGLPITETDFDAHPTHVLACPPAGSRRPRDESSRSFVYIEVGRRGRCVCVLVCMCVYVCACVCVYLCVCVRVREYVCGHHVSRSLAHMAAPCAPRVPGCERKLNAQPGVADAHASSDHAKLPAGAHGRPGAAA